MYRPPLDGGDRALLVVVGRQLEDEPGKIGPLCIACVGLQQNLGKKGGRRRGATGRD